MRPRVSLVKNVAQPELAAAWTEAYRRGIADELCDRIVHERPVPARLLVQLLAGDRSDAT